MLRIFYYIITVKSQILISSFEKQKKTRGKIWFAKKFHNYVHAGTSSLDADFSSWFANNSFHYKSILWYMLVLLIYILQCLVQASACNSCYLYLYILYILVIRYLFTCWYFATFYLMDFFTTLRHLDNYFPPNTLLLFAIKYSVICLIFCLYMLILFNLTMSFYHCEN